MQWKNNTSPGSISTYSKENRDNAASRKSESAPACSPDSTWFILPNRWLPLRTWRQPLSFTDLNNDEGYTIFFNSWNKIANMLLIIILHIPINGHENGNHFRKNTPILIKVSIILMPNKWSPSPRLFHHELYEIYKHSWMRNTVNIIGLVYFEYLVFECTVTYLCRIMIYFISSKQRLSGSGNFLTSNITI